MEGTAPAAVTSATPASAAGRAEPDCHGAGPDPASPSSELAWADGPGDDDDEDDQRGGGGGGGNIDPDDDEGDDEDDEDDDEEPLQCIARASAS